MSWSVLDRATALLLEAALAEIQDGSGVRYCPQCAEAFSRVYEKKRGLFTKLFTS